MPLTTPPRALRFTTLLLLTPLMMAANCKKPPDDDDADDGDGDVQQIENPLAIVSIDPSVGKTGSAFPATVYGSGFESGATLNIGPGLAKATVIDANTLDVTVPSLAVGTYDLVVSNPDGNKSTLRAGLRIEEESSVDCSFARVYFGFDQSTLATDSQKTLDGYMGCYNASSAPIRLEGHADERGTTDYNLALGTRRAHAVERHLTAGGVPSSRVKATSYGEEKPLDRGHNETAWGKNRRVDVYVGN
ncbi:MAG: OmpA family protein [Proteobacteria bacterium]|nr:OmpA family protein [Pseudomonadota bacterium]